MIWGTLTIWTYLFDGRGRWRGFSSSACLWKPWMPDSLKLLLQLNLLYLYFKVWLSAFVTKVYTCNVVGFFLISIIFFFKQFFIFKNLLLTQCSYSAQVQYTKILYFSKQSSCCSSLTVIIVFNYIYGDMLDLWNIMQTKKQLTRKQK